MLCSILLFVNLMLAHPMADTSRFQQPDTCDCGVDFYAMDTVFFPIYADNKGQELICTLKINVKEDDAFIGTIYKIENGYAYMERVQVYGDSVTYKGWVSVRNVYTGLNIYAGKIPFYKKPTEESRCRKRDLEKPYLYSSSSVQVLDCKGTWIEIIYKDWFHRIKGWVPMKFQCANPYTTCC